MNVTSDSGVYIINGSNNPTLSFIRGYRYIINVNATGHPFWIQTVSGSYDSSKKYTTGVTGNGTDNGTIVVEVAFDAPLTLYYVCQYHSSMQGPINVSNFGPAGAQGATGATGEKGDTGDSGLVSATFISNSGASGYTGPIGTFYPMFKSNDNDVVYAHDTFTYEPSSSTLTVQKLSMSSDIKLKQNIQPLTYEYTKELLLKLKPVEYTFINDAIQNKRFGFIAQEVEESFKHVNLGLNYSQFDENGQENKYLSYLELIAPLIKVVNHLVDKVETLELEIEKLNSKK